MDKQEFHKEDKTQTTPWHSLKSDNVISRLNTNLKSGLSTQEAAIRLKEYGNNTLQSAHKIHWYTVFARQFVDVLILILVLAAAISAAIGAIGDAVTILIIVLLNGVLGFIQEWRAEKSIEALKQMLEPQCKVLRDGVNQTIEAKELVPGDVVLLNIGDCVPADIRLIETINLKVDESILTGESISVSKGTEDLPIDTPLAGRSSIAWMGTAVTNGSGTGVVTATGMSTEFGRIARLTETVGTEATPLQRKLAVLGKQLGILAVVISAIVALSGWLLGKPLADMLLTGIALAVAVVPEGLPAVVTITLALGIRSMVKRRALLRRLQVGEALGSSTVICTDKTGTLTQNQMTVKYIWLFSGLYEVTGVGYDPKGGFQLNGKKIDPTGHKDLIALLESGLHCNHASISEDERGWYAIGEPTEAALVVAAVKAGLNIKERSEVLSEFSFNSIRKRMTVIESGPEGLIAYVKGAPEIILERSTQIMDGSNVRPVNNEDIEAVKSAYHKLAENGLRTLAVARRNLSGDKVSDDDLIEKDLTFLGIVGILDPPRPEVPDAVRSAQSAGIRCIMITGDAAPTAIAIAKSVGIPADKAITGKELANMNDQELLEALNKKTLFARTTPEDKLRIINLLQETGHVVGMTGDGVNDAPALKKADIGIAMGLRGTEVAKGASDMILTDDNFASIIGAVEEGRRQYDNIQKFVRYLLSSNMGEVVAIFINILLGGPLILLPVQILWMNLVTDGMTAVALGVEPPEKGVMESEPRSSKESILNRNGIIKILLLGGYMGLATLWLFHHYLPDENGLALIKAQTMAFTGLIIFEKINVFNFRSLKAPLSEIGFFSNKWLLLAWLATIGLQVSAVYIPFLQTSLHTTALNLNDWLLIFAIGLPVFMVFELLKIIKWRKTNLDKS